MTDNARSLRRTGTAEERLLWIRLRRLRPRLTRQLPIGDYILDFACRTIKLAIEIDGSQHLDAPAYDARRTAFPEGLGWRVMWFWNDQVRQNPDGVAEAIAAAVMLRQRATHPQPLPFREGRRCRSTTASQRKRHSRRFVGLAPRR
jgi:very-short-patch-repair endonuclease